MTTKQQDSADVKLIPNREFARLRGVTMRTILNWEKAGVLTPPMKVNGRKYRRADEMPTFDKT